MSIKERRDIEKSEMKKKIMDATIEIVNQDGYENLSIRKIAARIEYSPTTIYIYYKDKAQIIADMANKLYNKIMDSTVAAAKEYFSYSVDRQVREILFIFIKELSAEPEMVKAIMYSQMNVIFANDSSGIPANIGINMLDQLIDTGIEQKIFKSNVKNISWMIISAMLGFVMSAVESQLYSLDNFNQLVYSFVEMLMGGISQ